MPIRQKYVPGLDMVLLENYIDLYEGRSGLPETQQAVIKKRLQILSSQPTQPVTPKPSPKPVVPKRLPKPTLLSSQPQSPCGCNKKLEMRTALK